MTSTVRPPATHRERLLAAAADFTTEHGWAALTMAKLADRVGVSRQTVYNELGGKPQLGEAMVMRELEQFLAVVDRAFTDNPPQSRPHPLEALVVAIGEAARRVLELAIADPLLRAILSRTQGADSELLPLLTTKSELLLGVAGDTIRGRVWSYDVSLDHARMDTLVDMVVRLVLSHVMQPAADPEQTSETIAWLAARVLADRPGPEAFAG